MNDRDDFTQQTKNILCKRVGGKCSNPNCMRETQGPHSDMHKGISIGQAAHITAASQGGPRYDPDLTSEQRKDISNGIWLCESCAKMIDNDEKQYPVELLKTWKYMAEYTQRCIINQTDNLLQTETKSESRKNIACREVKKALENLHVILQYAYELWSHNFKESFDGYDLADEIDSHWNLYEDNLKYIYSYHDKQLILYNIIAEYSLDLGAEVCDEVDKYLRLLNFSFQSDNWGGYDNYWQCFFDMISTNIDSLNTHKKNIDNFLHKIYTA